MSVSSKTAVNVSGIGQNTLSSLVNLGQVWKGCRFFGTLLGMCATRELLKKLFVKLFSFIF